MKKPLVTIITPSYNQGEFIEDTIKSVLQQTYKNFEYIIYDSCSTDNTKKILDKYSNNKNIKIIIEKDKGQSDAINKGFKIAKGEIVGWINSDDLLSDKCVELIVNEFYKNENIGIVYGNYYNIDEKGKKISLERVPNINLNRLLNWNARVAQPGSFYKTEFIKKVGYLDSELNYVMDYDLWIKLLKISAIKYVDEVVSYFRLHEKSKTVSQNIKFLPEVYKVSRRSGGRLISRNNIYIVKEYIKDKIKGQKM